MLESSIGVGSSKSGAPGWFRRVLRPVLDAKNEAERHLRAADLSYTIVRPGGLTDDPATGDVVVGEGGPTVAGPIPRADVARVMIAALDTPDAENRVFEIVARTQLRGRTRGVVDIEWADINSQLRDGSRNSPPFRGFRACVVRGRITFESPRLGPSS